MTPDQLARAVAEAVRRAVAAGELTAAVPEPAAVRVRRPTVAGRGDYATGIALRLAERGGPTPMAVARVIAARLSAAPGIARVEIADPGFLNVTLDPDAHAGLVRAVRAQGIRYGHGDTLAGVRADPGAAHGPRSAATRRLLAARGATTTAPAGPGPEPVAALGADATAWAHTRPAGDEAPDLRPAGHLRQVAANPLFRIRYAHARTRALLRNADDLGFGPREGTYEHPAETALLGAIGDYPRVLEAAARDRAPDRVARALEGLADAYLDFQDACRVLPTGDEKPSAAHRARLALAEAAGTVLAGGLTLLGISAPEHL